MKFQLAINLERMDGSLDMKDVARHTLEMVQMADQGGFNIAWAASSSRGSYNCVFGVTQVMSGSGSPSSKAESGTASAGPNDAAVGLSPDA